MTSTDYGKICMNNISFYSLCICSQYFNSGLWCLPPLPHNYFGSECCNSSKSWQHCKWRCPLHLCIGLITRLIFGAAQTEIESICHIEARVLHHCATNKPL